MPSLKVKSPEEVEETQPSADERFPPCLFRTLRIKVGLFTVRSLPSAFIQGYSVTSEVNIWVFTAFFKLNVSLLMFKTQFELTKLKTLF